jgi:cell division ATPase FtsA
LDDSRKIKRRRKEKSRIVLIATPKELIERYKRIAQLSGLEIVGWETEGMSIVRALAQNDKDSMIVMDIGTQITNLFVIENGFLINYENLNIGGAEITHIISQVLE